MTPIEQALLKLYGVTTSPVFSAPGASAGTTSAQVIRNSGNRLAFLFVNLSASDIFIAPFPGVTSTFGIFVPPLGGSFYISVLSDLILPSMEWYAIASAAGAKYFTVEQMAN